MVGLVLSTLELTASAQSYVGPPNTVGASLAYDHLRVKGFYSQCGDEYGRCFDEYTYTVHQLTFGAEYVTPVEGLAVTAQLNALDPKETGATAGVPGIEDEGMTLTDFRMDVRYALPMQPAEFRIAPQIGFTYPTGYDVEPGFHAAYGKKLKQAHLGLNVGRNIVADLYFDLNYTFTFSELPDEHPYDDPTLPTLSDVGVKAPHRSDIRLDLGYFILPELSAGLGVNTRFTHGGFSWKEYATWDIDFLNWTPEQISKDAQHDRVNKEHYVIIRAGAAYQIIEGLSVYSDVYRMVRGASTSGVPIGFAIGVAGEYTL